MGIALTEEQVALADSVHQFTARHVSAERTRAEFEDLASGMWADAWTAVTAQGWLGLHLPEEVGGDGAGLPELAVLLEETGRALVPGPLLTTVLTGLAVRRHGSPSLVEALLPRLVAGASAGAACTVGDLVAAPVEGGWEVGGTVPAVSGALSGQHLLLGARAGDDREVWFVVPAESVKVERVDCTDLTRDLGTVTVTALRVAEADVLSASSAQLRTLAAVLHAAEAVGVARWCQETGLAYVKVREQFGVPIGSFQSIKHKCARLYARLELMTAAAWDAATTVDGADRNGNDGDQARYAAAAAAVTCLRGAVDIGLETITLLGGIGYTWEHDVHLYWRRAMALTTGLGPDHEWETELGTLADAVTRHRRLELDDEPPGLRERVAHQLAEIAAAPPDEQRALIADRGLAAPHYVEPYGLATSAAGQVVVAQEFERIGLTQPSMIIGEWALPTILAFGTDAQRERFARPSLRGELSWCQLFSEPGAGSDLASLRTRATRDEGGWRLSGQKVWTSQAHDADWGICLARTDPDAPKHKGISYFLVEMTSPGVEVRPLREANGGYMFNEVFLDEVFVPDELMVGAPGSGWKLARSTLGAERISIGSGSGGPKADPAAIARGLGASGPAVTRDVGRLCARTTAVEALVQRGVLRRLQGSGPGGEASVLKLLSAETSAEVRATAQSWVGPTSGPEAAVELLSVPPLLIGGGTSEIQLNVIAEHVLGLPRG